MTIPTSTIEELLELEARANVAPWLVDEDGVHMDPPNEDVRIAYIPEHMGASRHTSDLIAQSRNILRPLLEELLVLRELSHQVESLRDWLVCHGGNDIVKAFDAWEKTQ